MDSRFAPPATDDEKELAVLWADLLDVAIDRIGRETSFFELGGDSISAIQLVSRCRQVGWKITSAAIFRSQTLRQMSSRRVNVETRLVAKSEAIFGEVKMTPIQKIFFESYPKGLDHYNQSMIWAPRESLSLPQVQKSISQLCQHHDMLRATYTMQGDGWVQEIQNVQSFVAPLVLSESFESVVAMEQYLKKLQLEVSLKSHSLMKVALLVCEDRQYLFITCHHLVIDLVSWRLMAEDLETLLSGRAVPSKTDSFQEWSRRLTSIPDSVSFWEPRLMPVKNCIQRYELIHIVCQRL